MLAYHMYNINGTCKKDEPYIRRYILLSFYTNEHMYVYNIERSNMNIKKIYLFMYTRLYINNNISMYVPIYLSLFMYVDYRFV